MTLRSVISRFKLDRADALLSTIFRFHDAPWYYLLTGADFEKAHEPDVIVISTIVEVAKEAVLYVGVLDDFYFDSNGQLDRLILQNVMRRPIARDKPGVDDSDALQVDRFYPIDGDNFVIRYSEMVTLNVQYLRVVAEQVLHDAPSGGGD